MARTKASFSKFDVNVIEFFLGQSEWIDTSDPD
jgi:hypothetical protein